MRPGPLRSWAALLAAAGAILAAACNQPTPAAPVPPPTPEPTPVPTPTPIFGCGLPRGTGLGRGCPVERAHFQPEMEWAIDKVIDDYPGYFDKTRARGGPFNFRVKNVPQYVDEVVYNLRTIGLCALNDGEEIAVKNDNDFNDQYDIITADGFVRRSYRVTCRPAWNSIPPHGDE
jgi:hypothetical protein